MGPSGRAARRVHRLLADDEAVLTTLVGVEAGGRRRRLVVVTERRAVISSARPEPPLELALDGLSAEFAPRDGSLTLRGPDDVEVALHRVDPSAARVLVDLIAHHRTRPAPVREATQHRIRLVSGSD